MGITRKMKMAAALFVVMAAAALEAGNGESWRVERPKDDKPAVLFIGHPLGYVEPGLAKELTDKGFIIDHTSWENLNAERLRRFNAVVLLSLGDSRVPWGWKFEDYLDEYLRWGGGVITFFNRGEAFCPEAKRYFAKLGLELLHMSVLDPDNQKDPPRPRYVYGERFSPADTVKPSPISAGVRGLLYGQGNGGYMMPYAHPLLVDANWTPVVLTRPTAFINAYSGFEVLPENVRMELNGRKGEWPLVAVRSVGPGRMVALGLRPMYYAWAPLFDKFDQVCHRAGIGDTPSDFATLLENSLRWTAEPSLRGGTLGWWAGLYPPTSQGDTSPVNWTTKTFERPGPWLKGHIGARTAYSGGKGAVADWVAAAKAEGLSFLVFLDDMSAMTPETWAALQKDCKTASAGDFRAYPGMRYKMTIATGGENFCFVVDGQGKMPFPLPRHMNERNEIVIKEGMSEGPYHLDFNTNTSVGFMRHKDNATPYWDYKLHGALAVITKDATGAVLDDAIGMYLEQMPANVSAAPLAVELLDDPAQLAGVLAQGRPHAVVNAARDARYPHLPAGLPQVDVHVGSQGDEWNKGFGGYRGWWGPCATEGPMLSLRFRGGYQWKGVEYPRYWIERHASVEHKDWFMDSYARLPLRIDAASDEPLAELVLHDGPAVLASFDVKGKKEFSTELVVPQDKNRHLVLAATDAKGRRAVTMEVWTEQQQNLYDYCADRINAPLGRGSEPGHGNAWTEGCLKMKPALSVYGAYPRNIAGSGQESRRYQLDLCAPDLFLERASSAHYFPTLLKWMDYPWHNWTRPEPRDDVRHGWVRSEWYQSHGRNYLHPGEVGVYWDGYPYGPGDEKPTFAYYGMQDVWGETLKELTPVKDFGFVPGLSHVVWERSFPPETSLRFKLFKPGEEVEEGDLAELAKKGGRLVGDLPDGAAITVADADGFTVRVHGQGLGYAFQAAVAKDQNKKDCLQATLRIAPRTAEPAVKAGAKYAWRYETVAQIVDNPLAPDISWINVAKGKLTEHFVGATIEAERGVCALKINKTPFKTNSVPLIVKRINSNWTCGYFEPMSGLYRTIGSADGVAYAQVDASRENIDAVVGNVVTCDHPELRILATRDTDAEGKPTGTWRLELLNPSATPIETTLFIDPAFSLIKSRTAKASIAPKGHVTLQVD